MKRKLLPGDTPIVGLGDKSLQDFWSWAFSDVLDNLNRSVFGEFIVAHALGALDSPRKEWDAYDLDFKDWKIEVKSAGLLQSWNTDKPSQIVYNIAKKRSWYADTNTYSKIAARVADCYVFCLLAETDRSKLNVLDINQWRFWILSTKKINETLGEQKTITRSRLEKLATEVSYDQLRNEIIHMLGD